MSDLDTKTIRSIYSSLMSAAKTTHGLWEEIAKYHKPQRLGIESQYSPGSDLTTYLYDSTALTASKDWCDAVHFAIANPFIQWFDLELATNNDDEVPVSVTDWCQDSARTMRKHLRDSNFTASLNEAITDWGLFGNCSMQAHAMPGDKFQLAFESLHLRNVVPMISAYGRIQTTFHECRMTVKAMAEQFAMDEWNAGNIEALREKLGKRAYLYLKNGQQHKEISLLHAVYPRQTSDVRLDDNGLGKPEQRPYASIWMVNDDEGKQLRVGGYYEQSRFWARMRRRTDDPMGGGIGEIALPDVYSANEWRRLILNAADKEIDPPWLEEASQLLTDLDQRARGITTVRDLDRVRQIEIQPRTLAQMVGQDMRQSIRDIWMADEIKLPPREAGAMTAYEVSKRIERIYQLMGPEIDRLHTELLRPLLERVFGILRRAGKFGEIPEEMQAFAAETNGTLEFKFEGPAVRSQSGEEVAALDDHLAYVMQAAQIAPEVLDTINLDVHLRKRAELLGYPMDAFNSQEVIDQIRADRQKQQQAMAAAETAKNMGAAAKSLQGSEQGLQLLAGGMNE